MRILKISIFILIASNLFAQKIEDKICQCIKDNFNLVGLDYFQFIDEVETDLIKCKIIEESSKSRHERIILVSKSGKIEEPRAYEHIKIEQLGLMTIKYCVNLITYSSDDCDPPSAFHFFREVDFLAQLHQGSRLDLNNIKREIAKILVNYNDKFSKESNLWRIIQMEYLYWFSDTNDFGNLVDLPPFNSSEQDTSNTVKIHVGANDTITFEGNVIEQHEICKYLTPQIIQKKGVHFFSDRDTRYKLYLNVYNELKDCFLTVRDVKAVELYQRNYAELSIAEKEFINEMILLRIIETEPK